jgi:ElaB/YqjD/DUF883 family membrane-anchored ribosome-binding protein
MVRFVMGALAGGLAVWFWGDELRRLAGANTRDVRAKAADKLQAVKEKAQDVLDRTKEQVSSTLQASQDALRPRMG